MSKLINLTGIRFGRLVVIERAISATRNARWVCICDCGNSVEVLALNLRSGDTKSCGCFKKEHGGRPRVDITGQRFGRLTCLEHKDGSYWIFLCDCSKVTVAHSNSVRSNLTRSCGCLRSETSRANLQAYYARR